MQFKRSKVRNHSTCSRGKAQNNGRQSPNSKRRANHIFREFACRSLGMSQVLVFPSLSCITHSQALRYNLSKDLTDLLEHLALGGDGMYLRS